MKVAIIEYPASNGAKDMAYALGSIMGFQIAIVPSGSQDLQNPDLVVVPGGSAFGDYLRPGALTQGVPVSGPLKKHARDGGMILGVGNGFQILCELDILPGALLINPSGKFNSDVVHMTVESNECPFTKDIKLNQVMKFPLSCYYGRYWADSKTLRELQDNKRIAFRYCDEYGDIEEENEYNSSLFNIAGVISRHGNAMGVMAHPERAVEELTGCSLDGKLLFENLSPGPAKSAEGLF